MVSSIEERLERLEEYLSDPEHGDEVMLLSELDGFLAGIVVCPELIMPSEWLEEVWGGEGPVFEEVGEANEAMGLIVAHYNDVLRFLGAKGRYAPILDLDNDGSLLWELWAVGFGKAVALRAPAWAAYLEGSEEVGGAFAVLIRLAEIADGGDWTKAERDDDIDEAIDQHAEELIADCVETLHAARLAMQGEAPKPAAMSVGRNDPCPCGSGKKFKKCCLH
ncbi:MAG TPA: UPF0149 family protein [Paracoccaceae bacterium]|nr:UPF0149 family protein [Paracoccaceae bacterium]